MLYMRQLYGPAFNHNENSISSSSSSIVLHRYRTSETVVHIYLKMIPLAWKVLFFLVRHFTDSGDLYIEFAGFFHMDIMSTFFYNLKKIQSKGEVTQITPRIKVPLKLYILPNSPILIPIDYTYSNNIECTMYSVKFYANALARING